MRTYPAESRHLFLQHATNAWRGLPLNLGTLKARRLDSSRRGGGGGVLQAPFSAGGPQLDRRCGSALHRQVSPVSPAPCARGCSSQPARKLNATKSPLRRPSPRPCRPARRRCPRDCHCHLLRHPQRADRWALRDSSGTRCEARVARTADVRSRGTFVVGQLANKSSAVMWGRVENSSRRHSDE